MIYFVRRVRLFYNAPCVMGRVYVYGSRMSRVSCVCFDAREYSWFNSSLCTFATAAASIRLIRV
jgi:hypothetical protein